MRQLPKGVTYEGQKRPELSMLYGMKAFACFWFIFLAASLSPGDSTMANIWSLFDLFKTLPF
jgi:hypothetical protein